MNYQILIWRPFFNHLDSPWMPLPHIFQLNYEPAWSWVNLAKMYFSLVLCVNFGCRAKWFSWTHIFSYSFPSRFITGYWTQFPVLSNRTCCLSTVNVMACIQSIILLSPAPVATTSLISVCESLFLFNRYIHLCHSLDPTYKWYMVSVFLFLTSLSMIISSCIHVAVNGIFCFSLWLSSIPLN